MNGLQLYYEIHGDGEPVVLVHGGGSTIESNWSRMIPLLAKSHRVIGQPADALVSRLAREGLVDEFLAGH